MWLEKNPGSTDCHVHSHSSCYHVEGGLRQCLKQKTELSEVPNLRGKNPVNFCFHCGWYGTATKAPVEGFAIRPGILYLWNLPGYCGCSQSGAVAMGCSTLFHVFLKPRTVSLSATRKALILIRDSEWIKKQTTLPKLETFSLETSFCHSCSSQISHHLFLPECLSPRGYIVRTPKWEVSCK